LIEPNMARQVLVLLLVVFAIAGLALVSSAPANASSPTSTPATGPSSDDIGNSDGPSEEVAEAAPVGGPVPAGVFPPSADQASSPVPAGGATSLKAVGVVGALVAGAVAAFFSF
jgi:hypothetical protein